MKLDSEDGTWSPSEFGMADKRTFPRHARGELVVAKSYEALSEKTGSVQLRIDDAEILGRVTRDRKSHSDDINTFEYPSAHSRSFDRIDGNGAFGRDDFDPFFKRSTRGPNASVRSEPNRRAHQQRIPEHLTACRFSSHWPILANLKS